jgi:hypothetical protein
VIVHNGGVKFGLDRPGATDSSPLTRPRFGARFVNSAGRNRRSVWTIATEPYPDAHFATFPEKLVEPCILAGTSARGACPACGAPWARQLESVAAMSSDGKTCLRCNKNHGFPRPGSEHRAAQVAERFVCVETKTFGWSPSCACPPAEPIPCKVLDPFAGSGTTVAVAERLGRVGIGVELKPAYLTLARHRTIQASLL